MGRWFPAVWIRHHRLVPALMSHSSVGLPFGQGSTRVFTTLERLYDM